MNYIYAMNSIIESIFSGITVEQFANTFWDKRTLVSSGNPKVIFSLQDFEDILNTKQFNIADVNVFSNGEELFPFKQNGSKDTVETKKLLEICSEQKTLRIRNINKYSSKIEHFRNELLENFSECQIGVNMYYCRGPANGLIPHYDAHHIFAYQIFGNKIWKFGGKVIDHPTSDHMPRLKIAPKKLSSLVLNEGEFIYIPKGVWHSTSTPEVSLHLTFGIRPPRWKSILEEFSQYIIERHSFFNYELEIVSNNFGFDFPFPNEQCLNDLSEFYKLEAKNFFLHRFRSKKPNHRESYILPSKKLRNRNYEHFKIPDVLKEAVEHIWSLSDTAIAIYLRGSYKETKRIHRPWDVDLYLVVKEKNKELGTIEVELRTKYPTLPPIDLTILEKAELLFDSNNLLKRYLLLTDAFCIKGEEIRNEIDDIIINEEFINRIGIIQANIVKKKLVTYKLTSEDSSVTDIISQQRTITKATLRGGALIIAAKESRFSRNLLECGNAIKETYPDLSSSVEILITGIKNIVPMDKYNDAVCSICDKIYEKWKHIID